MKKVISCLVAITLLLALTPLSFAESEWYKSDDGVLEVQVVSFEEKAYPQYTLQLCFRLDGRGCGQKVGLNTCRKEIRGCIQMNNTVKLSRFMRKQNR